MNSEQKKINNRPQLKNRRKQLRSNLTPAEARLWTYLKNSQLDGRKFRRQHSIGNYILDFYCPDEHLAVELDGDVHFGEKAMDYDERRDDFLKNQGIMVIRFVNRCVFDYPEYVIDCIRKNFGQPCQPPRPSGTPPCEGGEQDPRQPLPCQGVEQDPTQQLHCEGVEQNPKQQLLPCEGEVADRPEGS